MAEVKVAPTCPKCGSKKYGWYDNRYHCPACMNDFPNEMAEKNYREQAGWDTAKRELIDNARARLHRAVEERYISHEEIKRWCNEILKYIPDDFFANFYLSIEKGAKSARKFLLETPIPNEYLNIVTQYISKTIKNTDLLKDVQNSIITDEEQKKKLKEYIDLINDGTFYTDLTRDVFIAYADEDRKAVEEIVDYLEKHEGKKCFVSYRNLWNGIGTENYDTEIQKAMQHCKYFVFISSEHSRRGEICGTYKELIYLRDYLPNMSRVEYLLENYKNTPDFMSRLLKHEIFNGLTWVTNKEQLSCRISGVKSAPPPTPEPEPEPEPEPISEPEPVIPNHKHSYITQVIAPTCVESGYTEHICQCGYSYKSVYTYPTGRHTFGRWYVVKKATCTQDGTKKRDCTGCTKSETETISATGHQYSEWEINVPPTCERKGARRRICNNCGNVEKETLPEKGHNFGEWYITEQPTCTQAGSERQDCTRCNQFHSRSLKPTGHRYGEWKTTAQPTCEKPGERMKLCSGCGDIKKESISPTGHRYGEWKATAQPTGEKPGERIKTCSVCGNTVRETIPPRKKEINLSKKKKKIVIGCIIAVLAIALISIGIVFGTKEDTDSKEDTNPKVVYSEGLSFTLSGDQTYYIVSGIGTCPYHDVVIPETYENLPVCGIGSCAFRDCSRLTSITIPDSVTSIGPDAFWGCSGLTSIVIPDGVTSISSWAFEDCSGLNSIVIPDSVISIGYRAFEGCSKLTSVVIGNGVTSIDFYVFEGCSKLTSVTFKNTSGWYVSKKSSATSGTDVTVTDSSTNATNLKDKYDAYFWKRK